MENKPDLTIRIIVLDEEKNKFFNLNDRCLYVNGEIHGKPLIGIPYEILMYLAINSGQFLTEKQIRDNCNSWMNKKDDMGDINQHIHKIRTAIEDYKENQSGKEYIYIKCLGRSVNKGYCCTKKIVEMPISNLPDISTPSVEACLSNGSEHMDTLNYEDYVPSKTLDISVLCSKWHNYYQNAGRYKGYSDVVHKINNEKSIISTNVISNGTGEGKSLHDVVFNNGEIHNISLTAKGGYGKTFILLRFVDRIISEHKDVLPFYIPLNELDNSTPNCISEFIVSTAIDLGCEGYTQKKLEDALNNYSGTVFFLFDGLNEITDYESRKNIIKSIFSLLRWTQNRNNNIRMIITSRYDFSSSFSEISEAAFNNYKNNFLHYQVNELSDDVIKEYIALVGCDISFDTLSYEKKQLLRTPQGLHMYVCLNIKGSYTSEFKNLAELIEVYVEKIFKISTKSNYNMSLCNIGYLMVKNDSFRLNNKEYKAVLDSAGIDIDKFNREVLNANLLFSVNAYYIEFSHQNYRDYLCAKYIAGELSCISIDSIVSANQSPNTPKMEPDKTSDSK